MATTTESSDILVKQVNTSLQRLLQALENPDFYIVLLCIGIAAGVAVLASVLLRRIAARHLKERAATNILTDLLLQSLVLTAPLFCIITLAAAKPVAERFAGSSIWIDATIQLTVAWLIMRFVLLVVKNAAIGWFIGTVIFIYTALNVTGFMDTTTEYLSGFSLSFGKIDISMLNLVQGIIIFVIVFWLAGTFSRGMGKYLLRRTGLSYNIRILINKLCTVLFYFLAVVITLGAIGVDITALAVFTGALGVGIGFGLQKITSNFISGLVLLMEGSIKIGDLIEVEGNTGWVRQIYMRYILMETWDGREIMMPNEQLLTSRVTNITSQKDKIRIEIKLWVSYHSDRSKAQNLMLEAAKEHPRTLKTPAPGCDLLDMDGQGYVLSLLFWVKDIRGGYGGPRNEILQAIDRKFRENNILIAAPRQEAVTGNAHDILPTDKLAALSTQTREQ